jgi:hypothetical protein
MAVAVLMLPATARADFQTLYDDYRADGAIDGCAYSSSYLSSGLSEIPADVREYDPGFAEAINLALEQVAAGCGSTPQEAKMKNAATAADGSPGPAEPRPVAFRAAATGRTIPAVLVAVIVSLAGGLGTAAVLAARRGF